MRRKFRVRPRLVALAVITVVLVFAASAARSEISKRDKQALEVQCRRYCSREQNLTIRTPSPRRRGHPDVSSSASSADQFFDAN